MGQYILDADLRTDLGKSASRRLRRAGGLPGVVYGYNKETVPITLKQNEVAHHLEDEGFFSHILTLNISGTKEKVILKELQRHPAKATLLHIDLQRINEKERINTRIPLHYINADKCIGVKNGGMIRHVMTDIEVSCFPKDLPEYIAIDIQGLEIGMTLHLGDVVLPDGVENHSLLHGGDVEQPVVTVSRPRVDSAEQDEPETDTTTTSEQDQ